MVAGLAVLYLKAEIEHRATITDHRNVFLHYICDVLIVLISFALSNLH